MNQETTEAIVAIHCEIVDKINFACHQSAFAILRALAVENRDPHRPLEDLRLTLTSDPAFLEPKTWRVDRVPPGAKLAVSDRDVRLKGDFLLNLPEAVRGTATVTVEREGEVLARHDRPVELLAPNEWGGTDHMPELLAAFAKGRERPPAVVFEMIPTDMQQRLDMILKLPEVDADMVFDAVRWDESGWPSRDLYRPLMEEVVRLRAPVIAAGLPRKDIRPVSRNGLDAALTKEEQRAMRLAPLPPALMNALTREIVKSHCDMIPEDVARRMTAVQRLRDALLAKGVRDGYHRQGSAVLITGDGHARKDRAVPFYLERHGDVPRPLVVWQAEAREKAKTLADLMPKDARPGDVADIVIVTPRAKRKDPCEQFARFMKRKREN